MGICNSRPPTHSPQVSRGGGGEEEESYRDPNHSTQTTNGVSAGTEKRDGVVESGKKSPKFPFYSPSPAHYLFSKKSPAAAGGSANSTPSRFLKRPFPPPSPAKHIRALLARRQGKKAAAAATIPEGEEGDGAAAVTGLDKRFGFSKQFTSQYEVGEEVGRGHFGYTCSAKFKKGELKGQQVAVKVIPKAKVLSLSPLLFSNFVRYIDAANVCGVD